MREKCGYVEFQGILAMLIGQCHGHQKEHMTHHTCMQYGIPHPKVPKHSGVKKLTGQGIEKLNDDCRCIHLQSNKWDAPKDVVLLRKHLEHLADN